MSNEHITRAWKDPNYRASLSEEELQALPANPAGMMELDEFEQKEVEGGILTITITVALSCMSCFHGTCNTAICDITKVDCISTGSSEGRSTSANIGRLSR